VSDGIWLLLGLLLLAYLGSNLVGGRAIRGFGLPSGSEYLVLGFALGPHVFDALGRSLAHTFEPVVLVGTGWLALVIGVGYVRVADRWIKPSRAAAGVVLGLQAAGSCAAGLVYGAVHRQGSVEDRYVWCIAAMTALLTLPLLAAALTGSLLVLACALLVAGMATAPTMVTGMTLVQRHTPPGRLNEGMTLAVTGLLGGIACGSAAGGWTVEHVSPVAGYGVPVTAAAAALMIALVTHRVTHRPAESSNRFT